MHLVIFLIFRKLLLFLYILLTFYSPAPLSPCNKGCLINFLMTMMMIYKLRWPPIHHPLLKVMHAVAIIGGDDEGLAAQSSAGSRAESLLWVWGGEAPKRLTLLYTWQSVLLAILHTSVLNMRKRHSACYTYRRWWEMNPLILIYIRLCLQHARVGTSPSEPPNTPVRPTSNIRFNDHPPLFPYIPFLFNSNLEQYLYYI